MPIGGSGSRRRRPAGAAGATGHDTVATGADGTEGRHGDSAEDLRYRSFLPLMRDPLPYGMTANRESIEALVTYALQQKLIPTRPQLDQVFVDIDA